VYIAVTWSALVTCLAAVFSLHQLQRTCIFSKTFSNITWSSGSESSSENLFLQIHDFLQNNWFLQIHDFLQNNWFLQIHDFLKKLIPSDPRLLPKNWFLQIHDFFSFNFDFVRSLKDRLVPLIMAFAVFCVLFPFAFDLFHWDIWKKDVNELKLKFCRNFRMLISNHRIQEQDLPDYPKSVFWIQNAMKPSDSCKIEII
jgi:hypothetical protein